MAIQVKVHDKILRARNEVYDAIVQPEKMTGYFISSASGPMVGGQKILWEFADVGMQFEIEVLEASPDLISFQWDVKGRITLAQIQLEDIGEGQTKIRITEDDFEMSEEGVDEAMNQTQGWTDFVCCLKAWLYTGINLRNGQSK